MTSILLNAQTSILLNAKICLVSAFLIWGVIEDLRLRKVRNKVVLTIAGLSLAFATVLIFMGHMSILGAIGGFGTALLISLPFVLLGVLGAGDMKLLAACGFLMSSLAVFETFVYSFIWGSLIGVVQIVLKGQFNVLILNLSSIAKRATGGPQVAVGLHRIPYTVAIFMGWITHLTLIKVGVTIL